MEIYVVRTGDTVNGIADSFGVNVEILVYDNQLVYPYELAVGQALLVDTENRLGPGRGSALSGRIGVTGRQRTEREDAAGAADPGSGGEADRPAVRFNGYAYPFISSWVLRETLPFLTTLSVFSYGFNENGELVSPLANEDRMLELAAEVWIGVVLTLTPLGMDGRFNNALISSVVRSLQVREHLVDNLQIVMERKGYRGLDIDFEYILAEDRDAFTSFVAYCTQRMNRRGWRVSVALAPKTSSGQQGLLYEGKDYPALGAAANSVLLMTYEWGYTYGPPMAVAPLNMVRRVVEYAVNEIPPEKIDLGIPNYGYDWPLPFTAGTTRARTIGNVEAVRLAITHGVPIYFDEIARSPFFYYKEGDVWHEVWFEDVRSIQGKFDLMKEFGLGGAGYWNIMQFFRANWILAFSSFATVS